MKEQVTISVVLEDYWVKHIAKAHKSGKHYEGSNSKGSNCDGMPVEKMNSNPIKFSIELTIWEIIGMLEGIQGWINFDDIDSHLDKLN